MIMTHDHEQSTYLLPAMTPYERNETGGGPCIRVAAEAMCCGTRELR
jgi:hypothetical protein